MNTSTGIEQTLRQAPKIYDIALKVSRGIHKKVLEGGRPARQFADLLHGTWLGHPLHPVLTDVTFGALAVGSLLDFMGNGQTDKAADTLIEIGAAAAIPTALTGMADFSAAPRNSLATGATHAVLNTTALALYGASILNRRRGSRGVGVFLSSMALGILGVSAWLGGELVFRYRVGVNKGEYPSGPLGWTPVMDEADLKEQEPVRVEVEGTPVLIYQYGGGVFAIDDVCSHEGGPLHEGDFEGTCVSCPWHQSVFEMKSGEVVHGPSVYPQARYEIRIRNGKVELRLPPEDAGVA